MNVSSKIKNVSRKGIMLSAVTIAMVGAGLFVTSMTPAAAETYNCDSNAVIYCGGSSASVVTERYNDGYAGHNTASSIQHVYSYFGISSSEIQSLKSTAQMGSVTKSGDVYIGSKLVATNALTAGRENIAGSKTVSDGGTTFYTRAPKVSFLDNSLDAYVVMQNGQFKFAILVSCGNPVKATAVPAPKPTPKPTPAPTPCYQCSSLTDSQDARNQFTFTAKASAINGAVITGYVFNYGDGTNQTVSTSATSANAQHSYANSGSYNVTVAALVKVNGVVKTVTAANCATTVKVTPAPTPKPTPAPTPCYQCSSLTDSQDARNQFTFTAKASAINGAVITGYVFNYGDGTNQTVSTSATSANAQHSYANSGSYNVTVAALVKVNGVVKTVTAANCATTVKVCPQPAAECTDLTLDQNSSNSLEVKAIVTDTTSNGATLTGVSYNWGDSATTPASLQTTAYHTYATDGTYNVVATLSFSNGVADSTCKASVTINTVTPTCDELDVNIDNTSKTVAVTGVSTTANSGTYVNTTIDWGDSTTPVTATDVSGQTHTYTANGPFTIVATTYYTVNGTATPITSTSCQQQVSFTEAATPPAPVTPAPTAPTQLVNTGAGNVIGLFAGATALGIAGYYFFISRRLSREN
jgi:hypothetical protein